MPQFFGASELPRDFIGPMLPPAGLAEISLEQTEFEMTLLLKQSDHLNFEKAVQSATLSTGNDFLFLLPGKGFPVPASLAACVRIKSAHNARWIYVYEKSKGGVIETLPECDVPLAFVELADAYTEVLNRLRDKTASRPENSFH